MLAAADLLDQRSNLFVIRHEPSVQRGSCIEFRRCLSVPHDLAATSEAIWGFRPHQDLRRHFVYEHVRAEWPLYEAVACLWGLTRLL